MGKEYPVHPVPAVAAVVIQEDCVLLVKRAYPPSQGAWSLPGGVLELGETLHAGLMREVREETGLEVEPVVVLDVLDHVVYDDLTGGGVTVDGTTGCVRFHYVLIDYLCRGTMREPASASDALDARWVNRRDLEVETGFALEARTWEVIQKGFRWFEDAPAAHLFESSISVGR